MPDSMPKGNESKNPGSSVGVRRAEAGDAAVVRALRLQALADAPDAFEFEAGVEDAWDEADWRRWIAERAAFVASSVDGATGARVVRARDGLIEVEMERGIH